MSSYARCCAIVCAVLLGGAGTAQTFTPRVARGFEITRVATVDGARELAVSPDGDLFVGTNGSSVAVIRHAEERADAPRVFITIEDAPVAGLAVHAPWLFAAGQFGIYRVNLNRAGSAPHKIALVRTSGISRDHVTTSLAVAGDLLYASVGSSCDACDPELDATRATIQQMRLDGSGRTTRAVRIRNAIALAVNPSSGVVWAGVAGQDGLEHGHPYEIFDAVTVHAGVADYGWPYCYENRRALGAHDCSRTVIPRVIFPAYETPIGAAVYPLRTNAVHAFPRAYRGGAFVTLHGSWHQPPVAPSVVFVPLRRDQPARAIDWHNPRAQWTEFLGGYQQPNGQRFGRPTGIAVGTRGDLFVSDDASGAIYRIRAQT